MEKDNKIRGKKILEVILLGGLFKVLLLGLSLEAHCPTNETSKNDFLKEGHIDYHNIFDYQNKFQKDSIYYNTIIFKRDYKLLKLWKEK